MSVPVSVSECGSYPSGIVTLHMYNERRQTSRTRMPGPSTASPIFLFFLWHVCLTPPPPRHSFLVTKNVSVRIFWLSRVRFLCLTHTRTFSLFHKPSVLTLYGCIAWWLHVHVSFQCATHNMRRCMTSSTRTSVCVGCRSRRTHTFTHTHTHIRTCSLSLSHTHTHTHVCVSPPNTPSHFALTCSLSRSFSFCVVCVVCVCSVSNMEWQLVCGCVCVSMCVCVSARV